MALMHLDILDWAVILAYLGFLLYLGLRGSRLGRSTAEEFILGGRMLTLPAFVAALVSTWYGGILGVGEFTYMYGIANWFVFGFPYYIFAFVFAFFLARKVRESAMYSIADQLYASYDRKTGLLGSVLVFFNSSPAPYVLMLAVLLQVVTGWNFTLCLLSGTALSVGYAFVGGFRAVVRTDLLQFLLMFGGFILLLAWLLPTYGFISFLGEALPETHLTLTGGHNLQYIVVWFFIALWTLVAPQFHQFTLSAKSPRTARNGILVSVLCWLVFDTITTLSGLYARALLPALTDATMAFPLLGEAVLPPLAKGLFYVGMLATVMSTTDGLTFISALTLGRDVFGKLTGNMDDISINRYTRSGIVITALVAVGAVLLFPSVIDLWYVLGTLFIPAMLLPLIAAYYPRLRIPPDWTFAAMLLGFLVSLLSLLWGQLHMSSGSPQYLLGLEPMYAGLAVTVLIYIVGPKTRRKS